MTTLACGHEEYMDGHCGWWACLGYINLCDAHCRDEDVACSLAGGSDERAMPAVGRGDICPA